MYEIDFYEKRPGESPVLGFIEDLRLRGKTSKDARVQYKQVSSYIDLLSERGTNLSENIVKHLGDGIWELRPGDNRVFFFCFEGGTYVLLHHFRKKSQKTPRRELDQAKRERADYKSQKGVH